MTRYDTPDGGFIITAAPINDTVDALSAPPIPRVQQSAALYDGRFGPLIDLSQAVPGYSAHPLLMEQLAQASSRTDLLGYGDIEGEDLLRKAYANDLQKTYGSQFGSSEVHITAGCNQAFVAAALTVAGAGDAVLLITPFYFNHDTTLAMLGINTRSVAASAENGFLPDPARLAAAITPDVKAIVCVTPNNPTGAIYPAGLMDTLFGLCMAHNIWLIVDETYRDFLPTDRAKPHDLFNRPDWRDHLIGLYSFSKSFCIPGHRLGAITAGTQIINNVAKVMDNLQICAPRAPQHAIAHALPRLDDWREGNRQEIARRRRTLERVIGELPDWHLSSVGAYFSYIRHPFKHLDSVTVAENLAREHGIICLPGAFFGSDQDRFLRLAFANVDSAGIENFADRLAHAEWPDG